MEINESAQHGIQPAEKEPTIKLTRRSFVGAAAVAIVSAAFRGPLVEREVIPNAIINADPNLAANNFIRPVRYESEDYYADDPVEDDAPKEEPPKEEPPKEEKPKEEPPKEEEKPEPAPKGLEQFANKKLPGGVIDRIKREGLHGKINNQRHIYDHVQKEAGVPWQIMAAINYREASLRPELSMLDGSHLTAGKSQDGVKIYNDAKKDAVAAAGIFKNNAKKHYGVDFANYKNLSETDIANALLAYNRGSMYKNNPGGAVPVSKSPYVYNYMDGNKMKWTRADSYDGSKRLNRMYDRGQTDNNLGALVIVAYLMQNS